MSLNRMAYRNSAPPPGYVHMQRPQIKLKEKFKLIDDVCCEFLGLIVDSGIFELDSPPLVFTVCSDDEDVLELPVERKEAPLIDLVEDEDFPVADVEVKGSKPLALQATTEKGELNTQEKSNQNITKSKSPVKSNQMTEKNELKIQEKNNENVKSKSPVKSSKSTENNVNTVTTNEEHVKKIKKKVKESTKSKKDVYHEKKLSHRSVKRDPSPRREKRDPSPRREKKYSPENVERYDVSPKRKPPKKEIYEDNSSDNSTHSLSYSRKKETKSSYADFSDNEDQILNVQQETRNTLYGYYYCELCKADMTSEVTYETHLKGKRHQKNLKQKNVVGTVAQTLVPFQVENNYPQPAPGVYRVKSKEPSSVQRLIDSLPTPCPGLHQVIEIQGLAETTFYCELCSAPCTTVTIIPHLSGYRHQLRCLKFFDIDKYESVRNKKKQKIERIILRWLQDIERIHGRGLLTVEKEFLGKREPYVNVKGERSRREAVAGPSHRDPEDAFPDYYSSTTVPDTSKSDYYCKICDSHMNSINMWEMHIRGKRHVANSKKAPGELPSKTKTVLLPNVRSLIMDELDRSCQPVVGLSDMRENRTPGTSGAMYNCFLCGACVTTLDVVDHILSLKHRRKFLENIKHPDIVMMNDLNMNDKSMESIIVETCAQVEREMGRGEIEVHVAKSAVSARW